jgi:sn-glycerol 3-phosphate transport system permease protein
MSVSLGVALLANQRVAGSGVYRTLLLCPYALSPAITGVIWALLFDPSTGLMTYIIRQLTDVSPNWMVDGGLALLIVVAAASWKMLGFNVVFFLAGLQAIPQELLEAASVDGASALQRFRRITFPLLSPITFFCL